MNGHHGERKKKTKRLDAEWTCRVSLSLPCRALEKMKGREWRDWTLINTPYLRDHVTVTLTAAAAACCLVPPLWICIELNVSQSEHRVYHYTHLPRRENRKKCSGVIFTTSHTGQRMGRLKCNVQKKQLQRVKRAANHQEREGLVRKGSLLTRAVISLENCSPQVREAGRKKRIERSTQVSMEKREVTGNLTDCSEG